MEPNESLAVMFAVTALRNALLIRGVLSQDDIDRALGEIFWKIAIDKTLGARPELLNTFDASTVENLARQILHPGYREER